jgi:type IV pilus assembly protein PilW
MKIMKSTRGQRGFTLLEVLIFSAIFGIVLTIVYLIYVASHTTFTWGGKKIELQQNARVALEMAVREIRMGGYDPSGVIPTLAAVAQNCAANPPQGSGPSAVQVACAGYIRFIADVTGDDKSDQVVYRLQGTQVMREISSWVGGVWSPNPASSSELAEEVTALSFTYYDGSDTPTATLADIRRITIEITAQGTAGVRQETFPLTMDARLRNLQ